MTGRVAVDFIDDWLERWDLPVGRTTIQWAGSDRFLHTRWRKLRETLLAGDTNIVAPFKSLGMEIEHSNAVEWKCSPYEISFSNGFDKFAIGVPYANATCEEIIGIAQSVADRAGPLYGFATIIDAAQSAIFYASGRPFNIPPGLEFEQILQFQGSKYSGTYVDKRLRDVYPTNFLSDGHLALIVNGVTLRTWIEKRKVGELTPLCGDLWTWRLPDEAIEGVGKILKSAGALIVTL